MQEIRAAFSPGCGAAELGKLAKLEIVMLRYAEEYRLDALTIQCWSAIQERIGLTPCLTNGRVSDARDPRCLRRRRAGGALPAPPAVAGETRAGSPGWRTSSCSTLEREDLFLAWHCGNAPAGLAADGSPARLRGHCSFEEGFAGALATV